DRPPPGPGARGPPGQGGRARDGDRRLGSRRVGGTDGRGGRRLLLLLRGGRAALDLERERCATSARLLALAGRRALPRGERPLGVARDADQGGRAGSAVLARFWSVAALQAFPVPAVGHRARVVSDRD